MKKILIIGGTRFIGPQLIKLLMEDNCSITIFNRGNNYNQDLPKNILRINGDRRDITTMKILSEIKYDIIYDLCCFNKVDANNLLSVIKTPKQIVFFSTAAVYQKPLIYPLYESSKLGEWSSFGDYGTNKVLAEKKYISYANRHGVKLTIFRPVYLLGNNNYFDRENYFFSRILSNSPILMPGNGSTIQQFGFLEDTVEAFIKIPQIQNNQIEIVNIAGNDLISLKDFILLCGEIAGKKPNIIEIMNAEHNIFEDKFYDDLYPFPNITFILSNEKMTRKYKILPTPLESGLRKLYKYWFKNWDGKIITYQKEEELLKKVKQF